jgi:Fur family ferric uptake transcriptional regulator
MRVDYPFRGAVTRTAPSGPQRPIATGLPNLGPSLLRLCGCCKCLAPALQSQAMHHARATLREQGYRLTPQRNLIWEVLRGAGRHMTAEEVAAEVRLTLPDVNLSTVYRTLDLLVSLDLVVETRLEGSASYYEVSPEPSHHHYVCTCCGAVGHFSDELLAPVHEQLSRSGFAVGHIQVTAFGRCSACVDKEQPGPARTSRGRS